MFIRVRPTDTNNGMEDTIAGFKVRGDWRDVVEHG